VRGNGRIYLRKGSPFYCCAYYLRGKQYRESTEETDEDKARKFLRRSACESNRRENVYSAPQEIKPAQFAHNKQRASGFGCPN